MRYFIVFVDSDEKGRRILPAEGPFASEEEAEQFLKAHGFVPGEDDGSWLAEEVNDHRVAQIFDSVTAETAADFMEEFEEDLQIAAT